jgi:hypothetical protein
MFETHPTGVEMIALMNEFNVSPESFYQRIANILKDFQIKNLFFYDFLTKLGRSLSKKKNFILQINKNHAMK